MKYGTLSVECSVSGVFFKDYPRVNFLEGPHIWYPDCFKLPFKTKTNMENQHNSKLIKNEQSRTNALSNDGRPVIVPPDICQSPTRDSLLHGQMSEIEDNIIGIDRQRSWMVQSLEKSASLKRDMRQEEREDTVVVIKYLINNITVI